MACSDHVIVEALGTRICETYDCQCVLETFHSPTYYMPPQAMRMDLLIENPRRSSCEWKGVAKYWDLVITYEYLVGAIWSYPNPTPKLKSLTGWYALYPGRMGQCFWPLIIYSNQNVNCSVLKSILYTFTNCQ